MYLELYSIYIIFIYIYIHRKYRCKKASPAVGHFPKEGDGTVQKADDKYISEQEVELLSPVWLHQFEYA